MVAFFFKRIKTSVFLHVSEILPFSMHTFWLLDGLHPELCVFSFVLVPFWFCEIDYWNFFRAYILYYMVFVVFMALLPFDCTFFIEVLNDGRYFCFGTDYHNLFIPHIVYGQPSCYSVGSENLHIILNAFQKGFCVVGPYVFSDS